jgi:hypothetical protein
MQRWLVGIVVTAVTLGLAAGRALAAALPGWEREYTDEAVMLISPVDANGVGVRIVVTKTEPIKTSPKAEFKQEVDGAVAGFDADLTLTQRSGVRETEGVLIEALKIDVQGVPIDLTVLAYPVRGRDYTAMLIAYPSAIADNDPRVAAALDFSAAAITRRFRLDNPRDFDRTAPTGVATTVYDNAKTAPKPAPPPPQTAAPQTQSGQRCERRAIWGFRVSYWCQPSGICNDRVIKGYETVCE